MKKIAFSFIAVMIFTMLLPACKGTTNGKPEKDSTKTDTLWNAQVQNEFFDTQFGASKEEVINNFKKHGFTLEKRYSTDDVLLFNYTKSKYFTFGGMNWERLNLYLSNGKFFSIYFYSPQKDKAAAMGVYNGLEDAMSKKYKLTNKDLKDTTFYANKVAYGRNGCRALIVCQRYESVEREIFYSAGLQYSDTTLIDKNKVSDEL